MSIKYDQRKNWIETFIKQFYNQQTSGRLVIHFDNDGLPCKAEPTQVYKPPQAGRRKVETGLID